MALILERRSRSAWWSRRIAVFSAVLFCMAALGHRYGLVDTIPFFWTLGVIASLALLALCLAAVGLSRIWQEGGRGARDGIFGALVALLVLAPFIVSGYRFFAYPALHDISTDFVDPPRFAFLPVSRTAQMNVLGDMLAPEAAVIQQQRYPEVTGRRYELIADRVLATVRQLATGRGWALVASLERAPEEPFGAVTIEAVARSLLLAFPHDVAIRIVDEDGSTYVDMRSASRYGLHDFGENARLIDAFLRDLDREVSLQAGVTVEEPSS